MVWHFIHQHMWEYHYWSIYFRKVRYRKNKLKRHFCHLATKWEKIIHIFCIERVWRSGPNLQHQAKFLTVSVCHHRHKSSRGVTWHLISFLIRDGICNLQIFWQCFHAVMLSYVQPKGDSLEAFPLLFKFLCNKRQPCCLLKLWLSLSFWTVNLANFFRYVPSCVRCWINFRETIPYCGR